jgi:Leucine-rich repeat (LRR) protein
MDLKKFVFAGLTHLKDLDLSRNNISSIDGEVFYFNTNVTFLRLASNGLTEINATAFSELDLLQHLDLSNNRISSIQPEIFHNNVNLEWLSLSNNRLAEIDPSTFQQQGNLSYLDLSGNMITQIKGRMFCTNTKLHTLLLANNNISEFDPLAFPEENQLSYLDVSGNKIEKLENLRFYRLKYLFISRNRLQRVHPRSFSNCKELCNLSLSENNISEINDESFSGLEKLEYLDLSSNNIMNISVSIFQRRVPQVEGNVSESHCISNIKNLNLTKNKIYYFRFQEYLPLNNSYNISNKFCELELLDLNGNCLSVLDDESMNVLRNSTARTYLSDNPWSCECSDTSESVYKILSDNRTLYCATPEYLNNTSCIYVKNSSPSVTSTSGTDSSIESKEAAGLEEKESEDKKPGTNPESKPLRANILIFEICVASVFVIIVVVLVITHAVGKPESDEFWWEDKLAKRNY